MEPHERLKAAREKAGYDTGADAARAMGIAPATYAQHENGTRGLRRDSASKYARFFHCAPEWLLYGRGDADPQPVIRRVDRMVPVIGAIQAGAWVEVGEDPDMEEVQHVPVYMAGFEGASLFALRVRGNSMDQYYSDGTMVIVCPAAEIGVREGDHVVVRRNRANLCETTLKEVVKQRGGIWLHPRSSDPDHQRPIQLKNAPDADDGMEIIGVVVSSYNIRPIQQKPLIRL